MTPEQYWDQDSTLVIAYRKAAEIKREQKNQELWLQGLYIYEALCDVAPILRAFGKKGTKAHKYSSQPYPITEKRKKVNEEQKDKKVFDKGLAIMEALVKNTKKKFERKEVGEDGNHD